MKVTDFEVVDHGIEHSQYFQGCGTAFTSYSGVVTGIGDNPREAFEDALENIAQMGFEVSPEVKKSMIRSWLGDRKRVVPIRPSCGKQPEDGELYYHVSIRFNVEEEPFQFTPEERGQLERHFENYFRANPEANPNEVVRELTTERIFSGCSCCGGTSGFPRLSYLETYELQDRPDLAKLETEVIEVAARIGLEVAQRHVTPKNPPPIVLPENPLPSPTEDQVMDDVNRCETDA